MVKWVIALIIGLASSLVMMTLIVGQVIEQGALGTDLVFSSFFVITGGFIFLQNASIGSFILGTIYYFIFFTFFGFIIGWIAEWLLKITKP